jgi:hypothetical protein
MTTLILFVVRNVFWNSIPAISISMLMLTLVVLLYARKSVIESRILRGYFGTNRYEASEIIRFVQKKSNDDLDSSGGDQRRVFPEGVLAELQAEIGLQGSEGIA